MTLIMGDPEEWWNPDDWVYPEDELSEALENFVHEWEKWDHADNVIKQTKELELEDDLRGAEAADPDDAA